MESFIYTCSKGFTSYLCFINRLSIKSPILRFQDQFTYLNFLHRKLNNPKRITHLRIYYSIIHSIIYCSIFFRENKYYTQHYTIHEVFHYRFRQQMWPNPQETADLVTFTEEIFNGKLHFFCKVVYQFFL